MPDGLVCYLVVCCRLVCLSTPACSWYHHFLLNTSTSYSPPPLQLINGAAAVTVASNVVAAVSCCRNGTSRAAALTLALPLLCHSWSLFLLHSPMEDPGTDNEQLHWKLFENHLQQVHLTFDNVKLAPNKEELLCELGITSHLAKATIITRWNQLLQQGSVFGFG